jgi:hypothetical protein
MGNSRPPVAHPECMVFVRPLIPYTRSASWAPQRDPLRERTRPALLQLAPGTVVLLDETLMAPGQLKAEGVVSMQVGGVIRVTQQQSRVLLHMPPDGTTASYDSAASYVEDLGLPQIC